MLSAKLLKKKNFLILISSLVISLPAFPWGKNGHRIVGELGYRQLKPSVRREVDRLLGMGQMPFSSIWADEIKSDRSWDKARPWHYINIPKGEKIKKIKITKDNIIWAMMHFEDVLRSIKYSQKYKVEALKFLIHFYGDFHQPLHLGHAEDKGGTRRQINTFGRQMNLHRFWDEEMIDFEKLSFTEWANYIGKANGAEARQWSSGSFLDWAEEIRSNLDAIYVIPKQIKYNYHAKHKVLLKTLLKQAGYRLAYTLNKVFLKKPVKKENKKLRRRINARL
jgi:hypothetical protein